MSDWQTIASAPDGVLIETKIDDEGGCRNEARLRKSGRLFWTEDGAMYVYYTPTHWRHISDETRASWANKLGHGEPK